MDKITRMLLLYSKLVRGEPVNKISFCMETESNERSFDRDIEDVRLYLSESFSTEEVIYDRTNNCYVLSGGAKQDIEITEYRFLERLLIQSELLRKDELIGLLTILASNTTKPKECLRIIESHTRDYPESVSTPLLKMHDDIVTMIASKSVIEIKYHEKDGDVRAYRIIPYDIEFSNGQIYLKAFEFAGDDKDTVYFLLSRIESFERKRNLSTQDVQRIEGISVKRQLPQQHEKTCIELQCKNSEFIQALRLKYKDSVHLDKESNKAQIFCNQEDFVGWILGQSVEGYVIINPSEIKETIGKRVIELYQRYGKE